MTLAEAFDRLMRADVRNLAQVFVSAWLASVAIAAVWVFWPRRN